MKKYECSIYAEIQVPLHHCKTLALLPDLSETLLEEVGVVENGGVGFGYRDASGPTVFVTFEEAFEWERTLKERLVGLYPPEIAGDRPARAFVYALLYLDDDNEWADFSDNHKYLEVEVAQGRFDRYDLTNVEIVFEEIDEKSLEDVRDTFASLIKSYHNDLRYKND